MDFARGRLIKPILLVAEALEGCDGLIWGVPEGLTCFPSEGWVWIVSGGLVFDCFECSRLLGGGVEE